MVGTIPERRDKWCLDNGGVTVDLQDDGSGPYVPEGQLATQADLEAIPDQTMLDYLSGNKIVILEVEVATLATKKVDSHIDPIEKAHWMGVADALARKQALYIGDQLGGNPDPISFPPLTAEDQVLWSNLAVIQKLTETIRGAATAMITSLYQMSSEEVNTLPSNWAATHILWP